MGEVVVTKKPEQKVVTAEGLNVLKTYRVVDAGDEKDQKFVGVGDMLVALPHPWGQRVVLNATRQNILSNTDGHLRRIKCLRDFSVESVVLTFDDNELPV